jgi:ABC-2 type transport system ATP-binding protein
MAVTVELRGLSKTYRDRRVVDDLSFQVRPGRITGFLGANGAGKTTTLRMLLGLVMPDGGTATFDGQRYRDLQDPMGTVGAVLDADSHHPGRSARGHLRWLAAAGSCPPERVDATLDEVGLTAVADRRVGGYSLGMRQRLKVAAALLGDPQVLVLDEPTNGLDPAGIRWLRDLLRQQADSGVAVLISSHLLAELEGTVDDVVVIGRGQLLSAGPTGQVTGGRSLEATYLDLTGPLASIH